MKTEIQKKKQINNNNNKNNNNLYGGFCRSSRPLIEKQRKRKKKDEYVDLAGELGKLWHINIIVIPDVTSALGTVPKGSKKGMEKLEI